MQPCCVELIGSFFQLKTIGNILLNMLQQLELLTLNDLSCG